MASADPESSAKDIFANQRSWISASGWSAHWLVAATACFLHVVQEAMQKPSSCNTEVNPKIVTLCSSYTPPKSQAASGTNKEVSDPAQDGVASTLL